MAILSGKLIKELRTKSPTDPGSFVITPLLDEEAIGSDSVDLRLGCHFLLPRLSLSEHAHFCPDKNSSKSLHLKIHVPLGKYLVVPAHQTVLGVTLEFIKLPNNICGQILTKSSIARTFILVETAPWVHPGYRGCLTLEIANVSNTPLLLYPGRSMAQLILMELGDPPEIPVEGQEKLEGTYIGPVLPEAPKFKNPVEDLQGIGVTRVWGIPDPQKITE